MSAIKERVLTAVKKGHVTATGKMPTPGRSISIGALIVPPVVTAFPMWRSSQSNGCASHSQARCSPVSHESITAGRTVSASGQCPVMYLTSTLQDHVQRVGVRCGHCRYGRRDKQAIATSLSEPAAGLPAAPGPVDTLSHVAHGSAMERATTLSRPCSDGQAFTNMRRTWIAQ